jgi:ubiquinone/menaquinone biosynthesis C-methylase UbiE
MKDVDYDRHQSKVYVAGRSIPAALTQAWMDRLAGHLPARRPLTALDLGSGTGRFTPALAAAFGEAVGVEPSEGMRAAAEAAGPASGVRYLAGRAEAIPLPDASVDLVLMFLSFHHVRDREAAGAEIARVLRPQGRVFIRSVFTDRFPDLHWHRYFPRAAEIERAMFPSTAEVEAAFAPFGLRRLALETQAEAMAATLAEAAERLKLRAISTFEHMSEAEIAEGFAALDADVARRGQEGPMITQSDVMVLGRP